MAPEVELTPAQAVAALNDLEGLENRLTQRVGALTCMVWGLVAAGIFMTYGVVVGAHLAVPRPLPRFIGLFLWLPWVAAGLAVTGAVWRLHAISLRVGSGGRRQWRTSLVIASILALIILFLQYVWAPPVGLFAVMLGINGLLALGFGVVVTRRRRFAAGIPMFAAGLFMFVGAAYLALAHNPSYLSALLAGAIVGVGFVGAGIVGFVRG